MPSRLNWAPTQWLPSVRSRVCGASISSTLSRSSTFHGTARHWSTRRSAGGTTGPVATCSARRAPGWSQRGRDHVIDVRSVRRRRSPSWRRLRPLDAHPVRGRPARATTGRRLRHRDLPGVPVPRHPWSSRSKSTAMSSSQPAERDSHSRSYSAIQVAVRSLARMASRRCRTAAACGALSPERRSGPGIWARSRMVSRVW